MEANDIIPVFIVASQYRDTYEVSHGPLYTIVESLNLK